MRATSNAMIGRRRWPRSEKLRIVAESYAPGASATAVAVRHGLHRNQLVAWRRQLRDHAAAQATVVQAGEQVGQFQAFRRGHELGHALGDAVVLAVVGLFQAVEEVGHRRLQQAGGVVELAGADAVGAALVLLDLLEGDAQGVGELGLDLLHRLRKRGAAAKDLRVLDILAVGGYHRSAIRVGRDVDAGAEQDGLAAESRRHARHEQHHPESGHFTWLIA